MADFDAGSIEGTIVLDRTPWVQGMRQTARDADDFERRRITGRVDADIRPARRQIDLLDGMLTALDRRRTTTHVDVDTAGSSAALAGLDTLLDRIDGRRVTTTVDLDILAAQAQANALDTLLGTLDGRRVDVGIDLDTAAASASLAALTTRLDAFAANRPTITVDVDATTANAQLTQIAAAAQALSGLRPSITVDVDTTWGYLELDTIRMSVVHLDGRHVNITVDVDAGAAIARLAQVEALLAQISALNPTIQIDVDSAGALGQLGAVDAAVRTLTAHDPTINVDLDAGAAIAQLVALRTAAAGAGTSSAGAAGGVSMLAVAIGGLVAVAASLLPALGAIAPALGGIAAIAGVAILAFKGVGGALSAYKAAQEDAGKSGAALASTELSNERAIRGAQQGIADARRAAADAAVAANRQVEGAQRQYAAAVRDEEAAQVGVAEARREALAQLQALDKQVSRASLSQESAALRVREAEEALEKIRLDSKASDLQKERADLTRRQAIADLEDQKTRTKELADQQAAAAKLGTTRAVEASKVVVDAKAREAAAAEKVVDAQRALSVAQENSARTQERGIEQVSRAVQSLADTQAQQAAAAAAQADQGKSAADKYAEALGKLSPAGRALVEQLIAMKPLLDDLGKAAQSTMLPGITAILGQITAMGPAITTVVGQFGTALGGFATSFADLMGTDRFQAQFKTIMDLSAGFTNQVLQSIIPLTDAFGAFGAASGPTVKALADGFSGLLGLGLPQFFQALTPGIGGAGQVLAGLFDVINGLLPIFGQLASMLATSLGPVMTALAPVIVQVAQAFVSALGPVLAAVGPLLTQLTSAFGQVAVAAAPVLMQLGQLFGQLLTALLPLIPPITELAMVFVNALGPIIAQLGPPLVLIVQAFVKLAGALVSALVPVVNALLAALGPIIPIIVDLVTQLVNMLVVAIMPLVPQLSQLAVMLIEALGPPILKVVQALVPVILMLAQAFVDLLPVVIPLVTLLIERAMPMFIAIVDIFVALMPAIMDLIPPLVDLLLAIMPLIEFGLQLAIMYETAKAALITWVAIELIIPLINGLVAAVVWLANVLGELAEDTKYAIDVIVGVFQWLYDVLLGHSIIPDIVNGLIGWFTTAWDNTKRIFQGIQDFIVGVFNTVYDKAVAFGTDIKESLRSTVDGIRSIWDGVSKAFGSPVKFVLETVWNNGLLKAWNFINDLWGGKDIAPVETGSIPAYATGGPISGPGTATSDSILARLSNGEFVQPVTAVQHYGPAVMEGLRTRSIPREALTAYATGGPVSVSRGGVKDGLPAYSWGGIVDVIKDPIGSAKGAWNSAWEWGKDRVHDGIAYARGRMADGWDKTVGKWLAMAGNWAAGNVQSPMLADMVRGVPKEVAAGISAFIRGVDAQDARENGSGGAKVAGALAWAQTQAGKPYQWGGSGNPSWDCSGFMAAIEEVILGRAPRRKWTTFDFDGSRAPAGWKQNLQAPFMIGITNNGVGHTAGTLGGVNVESRGGDGVIVGPRARGWNDPMFGMHYGLVASAGGGGGGAMPSGQLADWINAALSATGTPPPGSLDQWRSGMATLVGRESGGNPMAMNTTDSNAIRGNASRGLAQVIPTTFAAFRQPGLSADIFDPISNLAASINYIKSRYGNISAVQQANPALSPKGYALGGLAGAGELAMVGERGPELVGFGSMARVLDSLSSGNVVAQVAEVLGAMAAMARATSGASLPQQSAPVTPGPQVIQVRLGGEPVVVRIGEREFEGYLEDKVVEVVLADVEAAGRSR
ncbi:transglycosylase SLT domain-containing protein [Embleya sp. NPDC050154]|uniref:transglycosylase SLT domain-containing protein n=1 Tax=Embleya sp. NPDC050154 TaxID=3363988 RepID=UPI0037AD18C3